MDIESEYSDQSLFFLDSDDDFEQQNANGSKLTTKVINFLEPPENLELNYDTQD